MISSQFTRINMPPSNANIAQPNYGSTHRSATHERVNAEVSQDNQLVSEPRSLLTSAGEFLSEPAVLLVIGTAISLAIPIAIMITEAVTGQEAELARKVVKYSTMTLIGGMLVYSFYVIGSTSSSRSDGSAGRSSVDHSWLYYDASADSHGGSYSDGGVSHGV